MKYYNIEVKPPTAARLQQYLYNNNISFEPSAAGPLIHFEILTDAAGADAINKFIEEGAIVCI